MTIILKNVNEKFLPKVEDFSKSINAQYEVNDDKDDFEQLREYILQDLKNQKIKRCLKD